MRLMRIGEVGNERPIVMLGDGAELHEYVDVSDLTANFDEAFFASNGIERLRAEVQARVLAGRVEAYAGERVGAPIGRPHQIICIGLNYADHALETGAQVPSEPMIFSKSPNTLVGPNDDVRIPRGSVKTDWEIELGLVIGKRARYLDSPAEAVEHIAGYLMVNDLSERDFQYEHQGQFTKGKSAETFNPAGPWLATADEFSAAGVGGAGLDGAGLDVESLAMRLELNGEVKQASSTSQMVYKPAFLVYYLSQFMVLEPGDLINTGTPAGVGRGHKPELYLKAGDELALSIEGLGSSRAKVVNFHGAQ